MPHTVTMLWKVSSLLLAALPLNAVAADQWIVATDLWGNTNYQTLQLEVQGTQLTGTLDGDRVSGTLRDRDIRFTAIGNDGQVYHFSGRIDAARMQGQSDQPDTNNRAVRAQHAFSAWRVPARTGTSAQRHVFTPVDYANTFSADRAPVLVIHPGDSVQTKTLDSGGVDEHGVTRALFGNPQVGPFFVVGAEPGDTLAITLTSLKLNRDYADSLDGVVGRLKTPRIAAETTGLGKPVRWELDRVRGMAQPKDASGALKRFEVPVKPMLGGLAVAPGFGYPPFSTGDTADFGGNMDFNAVVEGNTVYLPVQQPGALLYLGDGHALQGDGETTQWGAGNFFGRGGAGSAGEAAVDRHATGRVADPDHDPRPGRLQRRRAARGHLRHAAVAAPRLRAEPVRSDPGAGRGGAVPRRQPCRAQRGRRREAGQSRAAHSARSGCDTAGLDDRSNRAYSAPHEHCDRP